MSSQPCPNCGIGRCQPMTTPFLLWANEQMVTVPNAPALKCDFCFQVTFDPAFVRNIEYMLWQESDTAKAAHPSPPYFEEKPWWGLLRKG